MTAGGANQLRAEFDANAFSGRLEGGYRFVAPWVGGIGITPLLPMKRPGRPDEIAEAIVFLLSDAASYISGAVLNVSGAR